MADPKLKKPIYRVTRLAATDSGDTIPVTVFRRKKKKKKDKDTVLGNGCCMTKCCVC